MIIIIGMIIIIIIIMCMISTITIARRRRLAGPRAKPRRGPMEDKVCGNGGSKEREREREILDQAEGAGATGREAHDLEGPSLPQQLPGPPLP